MRLLKLDWTAYFKAFCAQRGSTPVLVDHETRLLFSDGWMYHPTKHDGPEYPPPTNPRIRRRLQRKYWRVRKNIILYEMNEFRQEVKYLTEVQESRSAPLYHENVYWDEQSQTRVTNSVLVNIGNIKSELEGLQEQLKTCDEELRKLWLMAASSSAMKT